MDVNFIDFIKIEKNVAREAHDGVNPQNVNLHAGYLAYQAELSDAFMGLSGFCFRELMTK